MRTFILTSLTLIFFASNSILCRLALAPGLIDAASFTSIRLISGALALAIILAAREKGVPAFQLNWLSAFALFSYAVPFSFAYLRISAGVGALILFGAVQATMIGSHLFEGNRLHVRELIGLLLALAGLAGLTLPGADAPDLLGAGIMAVAGVAWGVYSLRGKGVADPLRATASNFVVSLVFVLPIAAVPVVGRVASSEGILLAIGSGALASGVGYAIWYTALRGLSASQAGIVQLLVPVLAAYGGVLFLDESVTLRLAIAGVAIFSGVTLAVVARTKVR
ncbi:MAG: DMT family transporter [Bacteroidetes bacterium]|nr:DMT family transporter [Bacteroidota bacterium]MCW5895904.1 DMT family transporter [Bacteroidota bacterium]